MTISPSAEPVEDTVLLRWQCHTQMGVLPWYSTYHTLKCTLLYTGSEQLDCILPSQKRPWNRETYCFNSVTELKLFLPSTAQEHEVVQRLVLIEGQGLFTDMSPVLLQPRCCFYLEPSATHKPLGAAPLPCVQISGVAPNPQGTKRAQAAKPPLTACSSSQHSVVLREDRPKHFQVALPKQALKNLNSWTPE